MSTYDTINAIDNSANRPACQPVEGPHKATKLCPSVPIGDITPTAQQADAIRRIKAWFKNGTSTQQVFRLFGYAGTGKTTLTRVTIEELGLPIRSPVGRDVVDAQSGGAVFAAFTGKAALVMSRHGTPASTIHSMCYRLLRPDEANTVQLQERVEKIQARLPSLSPTARRVDEACLADLKMQLANAYRPRFVLNPESVLRDVKLIVLDEVSMIDQKMAYDLLSFGKPILVLGDPGQLPPVRGQGYFTAVEPDVMLTEIHRQAQDSPILRFATMAREGRQIPFAKSDDGLVAKVPSHKMSPAGLLRADQVICGRNSTRRWLNVMMRKADGLTEPLPTGERDKVIVLRNRHDLGIVNGQFITLDDVTVDDEISITATVRTDDGQQSDQPGPF